MQEALTFAKKHLDKNGFLEMDVDPTMDLVAEIAKLKKDMNAIILAHYYVESELQDLADYVGDSLGLAQEAERTSADVIVFIGVHFMAETAKILNPSKKVLLPDFKAGCSLADSCPAPVFKKYKEKYADHVVVSYINCTAALKTLTDVVCTSSNAKFVIDSIPADTPIIFAPDKNLGAYLKKISGRENMKIWDGACMVHEIFSHEKIVKLQVRHPNAKFIAHPECEPHLLDVADYIGSTSGLLKYTQESDATEFIVATEAGILHQMQLKSPDKTFIPAPPNNMCACNDCPHMKRNSLEKLYLCMKYELPEIHIDANIIEAAKKPIDRMMEISKNAGL